MKCDPIPICILIFRRRKFGEVLFKLIKNG